MILCNLYRRNKYILVYLRLILRWTHVFYILGQGYLFQGLESQSLESRDWPNDFCPMGLESQLVPNLLGIWMSQRFLSRDCLSALSQSQALQEKQSQSNSHVPGFVSRAPNPMESKSHCPSLEERFQIIISRKFCVV